MRSALLGCCLIVALGLPKVGNAQVAYRPTPAPLVTAASATWQINGEPLFFAGSFYHPTGPVVFFDGQLMARVGEYLTVPLYADTTLEAYSRVFVPIGGARMKPYDRRRAGSLAGTVGSTTPSWPVQVATNQAAAGPQIEIAQGVPEIVRPVATSGATTPCACPVATAGTVPLALSARSPRRLRPAGIRASRSAFRVQSGSVPVPSCRLHPIASNGSATTMALRSIVTSAMKRRQSM